MPEPLLTKEATLTEDLKQKIKDLISSCRKSGDTGVDYPLDEEDTSHYLLWDTGSPALRNADGTALAGVLAVMPLSEESAECIAYVRPDQRRKGYFSHILLAKALEDFPEINFIFPVREPDPETSAVLTCMGADPDGLEYLMELELEPDPAGRPAAGKKPEDFTKEPSTGKKEPKSTQKDHKVIESDESGKIYNYPSDDNRISSCHLYMTSKDSVCLYNVETRPDMRGQGFGHKMIRALCEDLKRYGISRVFLHVGAENTAAVSLYEKAGFRTTEILSFYLF